MNQSLTSFSAKQYNGDVAIEYNTDIKHYMLEQVQEESNYCTIDVAAKKEAINLNNGNVS